MHPTRNAALSCVFLVLWLVIGGLDSGDARASSASPDTLWEVVETPADESALLAKLDEQDHAVWLDGDVLWLAKRAPSGPWNAVGGVSVPLTQIDGTDVWTRGLRWERWREAFMRIAFMGDEFPPDGLEYTPWRGEHAPAPAPTHEPASVVSFQLPGPGQTGNRTITIVLPPAHEDHGPLPAIVMADGQSAEAWGAVFAALVHAGEARPVAIVGVHSGQYQGDRSEPYDPQLDLRAMEYLEGFAPGRFEAHLDWVIESVLPEVAQRHGISLERVDLAVAGFSNGGSFAASAALRRSDVFGAALALSIGVPPEMEPAHPDAPMARFFLAAGELEPGFLQSTQEVHEGVVADGGDSRLVTFVAGHDAEMWTQAAARFLPEIFPPVLPDPSEPD